MGDGGVALGPFPLGAGVATGVARFVCGEGLGVRISAEFGIGV
jgi:hypothetical protein